METTSGNKELDQYLSKLSLSGHWAFAEGVLVIIGKPDWLQDMIKSPPKTIKLSEIRMNYESFLTR